MVEKPVILPILSWEESAEQFGNIHPDSGAYMEKHYHPFKDCHGTEECPWLWERTQPCQAYEHWDDQCMDCSEHN